MTEETWTRVDDYLAGRLLPADPVLAHVLAESDRAGLPAIAVSPLQGQFLHLLAKVMGARRILEIGTLGGFSTICLARALPADGRLVTLEAEPRHAEVAAANFRHAGLADRIELRFGRAVETLPVLEREGQGPFDLVFIDADKPSNADYLAFALRLTRPGSVIICDNVVRKGEVADPRSLDANVLGVRRFLDAVAGDPRLSATALQTVGVKGYDGFAVLRVEAADS